MASRFETKNKSKCKNCFQMKIGSGEQETMIIENAIIKISTLLALGFGEAG